MENEHENTPECENTLETVPKMVEEPVEPETLDAEPEVMNYTDPNEGQAPTGYYAQNQQFTGNQGNPTTGPMNQYQEVEDTSPLSLGDWLLTILALMIPCAGIVLYFVWAFSKNGNVNRKNYCRAYLIVSAIGMILGLVLTIIFAVALVGSGQFY
ncbi:MAG: hypothetical protein RR869_07960 [Lachnospiraceae bacterium]